MKTEKKNIKKSTNSKTKNSSQNSPVKRLEDKVYWNDKFTKAGFDSVWKAIESNKDSQDTKLSTWTSSVLTEKAENKARFQRIRLFIALLCLVIISGTIFNLVISNKQVEIKLSVLKDSAVVRVDTVVTKEVVSKKEIPVLRWFQRLNNTYYLVEYTLPVAIDVIAYAQIGDETVQLRPTRTQDHLNRKSFFLEDKIYKDVPEFGIYAVGPQGEKSEVTKIYNTRGFLSTEKPK